MGCKSHNDKTKQKAKHKKGLWSPEEDQTLRNYILLHGHASWTSVPKYAGLQRNGKSCRLRWINYLRPGLKRGTFSTQEEDTIRKLHQTLGNKWSLIAQSLPGRTDNEIKNYWHSHLKKKTVQEEFESFEIKSNTTSSTLESNQIDNNQNISLPKILFTEWLTLDDIFTCNNYNNNSNDINHTYNLDLQESCSQGATTFNQESCNSNEFFDGADGFVFNSGLKYEDQPLETRLDDLLFTWE